MDSDYFVLSIYVDIICLLEILFAQKLFLYGPTKSKPTTKNLNQLILRQVLPIPILVPSTHNQTPPSPKKYTTLLCHTFLVLPNCSKIQNITFQQTNLFLHPFP